MDGIHEELYESLRRLQDAARKTNEKILAMAKEPLEDRQETMQADPMRCLVAVQALAANDMEVKKALKEAGHSDLDGLLAELSQVKRERDAAVADLEKLMLYGERVRCEFCGNDRDWCADCEVCAPVWRGPQEEAMKV